MNRERVPSQVDRRTKDMKPATLGLHLLPLRMARPDLSSSPTWALHPMCDSGTFADANVPESPMSISDALLGRRQQDRGA